MKRLNLVVLAGITMLIAGCSNIPLSTMYKMMTMDPLDVDPRQLVVAVRVPEGIKVRDGDIIINFSFQTKQPDVNFKHKFLVQVNPD
ncbi:MAG: hypothetical protein HAW66_05575 [Shewanella sp.]|nr:hypothetical protein [Shewanella sp.]